MYPLDPISDRPDYQEQRWRQEEDPYPATEALWLLVAFAVAVAGIAMLVSI